MRAVATCQENIYSCVVSCGSGGSEQRLASNEDASLIPSGVMNMGAEGDYCTAKSSRCEREEMEGS